MKIDPSVRALLLAVMRRFPAAAKAMVRCAKSRRSVAFSTTDMLEAFALETRRAVKSGDTKLAAQHLAFMSERLRLADGRQREYIDVYYVEGLLHGLDAPSAKALWRLLPDNLRSLYVAMWGDPKFPPK